MTVGTTDDCVVDTDVLSYVVREDTRAALFEPYLNGTTSFVSFMTLAELDLWVLRRALGEARQQRLIRLLGRFRVVFADRALCQTWAEVRDQARRNGRRIETADAWIAATALSLGVPLVTNNRDDFAGVPGLTLLP